jgi:CubicO group peptidase (beta-lactamase class C family)
MKIFGCIAVLMLVGAHASAQAGSSTDRRVDSLFASYNQGTSPGLAVAVVRDGKLLLSRGYGLASLENHVPVTPNTVFDLASVSKQFTGLAVAMLVEDGRVRLSDDIHKYIPELADFGHPITIDNLLHHTSGIRDWPGSLAVAGWQFDDVIAFDQILRFAYAQRALNFVPGAEYTYSNTNYNLLAEMIARVTGEPFPKWMNEHLFQPLGMTSTRVRKDHNDVVDRRAFGYTRRDGGWHHVTNDLEAFGSSSMFSTADDIAKWVMNFDDPKVGGRAAMALTRTRGALNDGTKIAYAFGIQHGQYRGVPTEEHSGGWAGFSTYVLHFPAQRLGVIILENAPLVNPARAAYDVADIFLDRELAARPAPQATLAGGATPQVAPATLDKYAGLYRLGPGWFVRIHRGGNALQVQATREDEVPMSTRSDTSFWVAAYNSPMLFTRENGRTTLVYRGMHRPKLDETPAPSRTELAKLVGTYDSDELDTHYRISLENAGLVMHHFRLGDMPLAWLWGNEFGGDWFFMHSVEFQHDPSGRITGFVVNVDERSRNIRFTKRD